MPRPAGFDWASWFYPFDFAVWDMLNKGEGIHPDCGLTLPFRQTRYNAAFSTPCPLFPHDGGLYLAIRR